MKSLARYLNWLPSRTLRWKLIYAFSLLVVLIAGAGGTGVLFMTQVKNEVDTLAQIGTPVVKLSRDLVDNMREVHMTLLEAQGETERSRIQSYEDRIDGFANEFRTQVAALREIAEAGDLQLDLEPLIQKHQEIVELAHSMLGTQHWKLRNEALRDTRFTSFQQQRQTLNTVLVDFTRDSEAHDLAGPHRPAA